MKRSKVGKLVAWVKQPDGKWIKDGAGRAKFKTKWITKGTKGRVKMKA